MSTVPNPAGQVNPDTGEFTPEQFEAGIDRSSDRLSDDNRAYHPETLAPLSYSEGYVYRALWYSRGNRPPYPETTKNDPRRLLMRVNAFRFEDGRRCIAKEQLRELVSSLRDKGYIEFRPNRRRRKPTGKTEGFRRGSFVAVIGPAPRDIEYLARGHGRGKIHLLARLVTAEKPALEDAPPKNRVDGHEVTNSPLKQREETESSSGARERATVATKEIEEIEEKLTGIAETVSGHHGTPWRPCEEKRSWRVSAITRALDWPGNSALLELAVIGTSVRRAKAIARAKDDGQRHRYWEESEADIVATAASYFYRDRQPWHWEEEINLGFRELVENYGEAGDIQDFTGVTLQHEVAQLGEPAIEHERIEAECITEHEAAPPMPEPPAEPEHVHRFKDKRRRCQCHTKIAELGRSIHEYDDYDDQGRCTVPVIIPTCVSAGCGVEGRVQRAVSP